MIAADHDALMMTAATTAPFHGDENEIARSY